MGAANWWTLPSGEVSTMIFFDQWGYLVQFWYKLMFWCKRKLKLGLKGHTFQCTSKVCLMVFKYTLVYDSYNMVTNILVYFYTQIWCISFHKLIQFLSNFLFRYIRSDPPPCPLVCRVSEGVSWVPGARQSGRISGPSPSPGPPTYQPNLLWARSSICPGDTAC